MLNPVWCHFRFTLHPICMHKILRVVYGMLKHNQPFDEQIDINNRKGRVRTTKVGTEHSINRRIQDYDADAPVSRRQRKKRLERERPHSVDDTKFGVTAPVPSVSIP